MREAHIFVGRPPDIFIYFGERIFFEDKWTRRVVCVAKLVESTTGLFGSPEKGTQRRSYSRSTYYIASSPGCATSSP